VTTAAAPRRVAELRHLAEREVFVEALGRQPSTAHESSATNARPADRAGGAAIEIDGHAAARAGVLEQAEVLLRRAEKHRHLVERHAAAASSSTRRTISTASRPRPARRTAARRRPLAHRRTIGLENVRAAGSRVARGRCAVDVILDGAAERCQRGERS
jgi:hypothetical protein